MRHLNRRSCLATIAGAISGTLVRGFQSAGADPKSPGRATAGPQGLQP